MKFAHNLYRYQIIDWSHFYIDYGLLKRHYKLEAKLAVDQGRPAEFTEFSIALKQNLVKAETFYRARYATLRQELDGLRDQYNTERTVALDVATKIEIQDSTAAFFELHDAFKDLQWFELVNFNKILGKLEKFQGALLGIDSLAISDAHLATRRICLEDLQYLNTRLATLQSTKREARHQSTNRQYVQFGHVFGSFPAEVVGNASIAIDRDDTLGLSGLLERIRKLGYSAIGTQRKLFFQVLYVSVLRGSTKCIDEVLSRIIPFEDGDDHLHRLIINIGRIQNLQRRRDRSLSFSDWGMYTVNVTRATNQIVRIINQLGEGLEDITLKRDSVGRIPLHHAVQYGLFDICQGLLQQKKNHEKSSPSIASCSALLSDSDGYTSMDIAVLKKNEAITRLLLEDYQQARSKIHSPKLPGSLLATALRLDFSSIVQLLLEFSVDVLHKNYHHETSLYLAVRSGRLEVVTVVLEAINEKTETEIDAPESVCGWTPLILACVNGNLHVVELLLGFGADPRVPDFFGWTAIDHAAFRGNLPITRKLAAVENLERNPAVHLNNLRRLEQRIRKASPSPNITGHLADDVPPGHSQIYVNLGPLDTYKPVTAVNLNRYVAPEVFNPQHEAQFQIQIRAVDEQQSSPVMQLPILEDMANKPWRFTTGHLEDFQLSFNILRSDNAGQKAGSLIGRAVALPGSLKQGLGSGRESLIRDFTIPILEKETLQCIGTVTFYFLTITPFPHPSPAPTVQQQWDLNTHSHPTIIGHRGIGQNDPGRRQLQIGENTVESFKSAMNLGASYVEFDVQLTKDSVPIIYHDFLMSETGIDAALHSLSLEQFMYISEAQSTLEDLPSLAEKRYQERLGDQVKAGCKQRSHSLNVYEQPRARSLIERMKHTYEFKLNESKGFESYKGNIRSEYIQASFMTLEEMFTKLPENVRFDIEIKYPMLFEAHDWAMDTYGMEVNHIVDTVLEIIYRLAGNRTIFLSSFSPEICILLSKKQQVYPVFFLTESGHIPSADARADSLQEAIHFAQAWRLPGIICRSQPFVMCPDLIKYVKDCGLMCISWGELNDDPEHAKAQVNAGLDAIIVNSVNLIVQTLAKQ